MVKIESDGEQVWIEVFCSSEMSEMFGVERFKLQSAVTPFVWILVQGSYTCTRFCNSPSSKLMNPREGASRCTLKSSRRWRRRLRSNPRV
jgi:hypothetical protein